MASWAFEMESIILGWYILVESGSVLMLVAFGALQFFGSLLSPLFGVLGDRVGFIRMYWISRAFFTVIAGLLMLFSWGQMLSPTLVLFLAGLVGMIRPSDLMMRNTLIAQSLPSNQLMKALGVSRITMDSARIAGALFGAGVVTLLGMSWAYVFVTSLYFASFYLARIVKKSQITSTADLPTKNITQLTPARDLVLGMSYVWNRPVILGAMSTALLINLFAFPFVLGLLPYVAKNIYFTDQTGLGFLSASFASGALIGSVILSSGRIKFKAAKTMIISSCAWFLLDLMFAFNTYMALGMAILCLAGLSQSLCVTPLSAVMLRSSESAYRGRVMGLRMLAVWGLPTGLLLAGPLINQFGFSATTVFYSSLGIFLTVAMTLRWRSDLWSNEAPGNSAF